MRTKKNIDIEKAIDLYVNQKMSTIEVSKTIGCSVQTLINRLRENNIIIRSNGEIRQKISIDIIRHAYEVLNMSTTKIAKKYGLNPVSVWSRLKRHGVKLRDRQIACRHALEKIPLSEYLLICNRYQNNKNENISDIAKDYKVHVSTISTILKKSGIKSEIEGSRLKSWKGGITVLHKKIRNSIKMQEWKMLCMERDRYICQKTGQFGGKLNVHHKKSFAIIFDEFLRLHPNLDSVNNLSELYDLALFYMPFWNIDNGVTVSENWHKSHHDIEKAI